MRYAVSSASSFAAAYLVLGAISGARSSSASAASSNGPLVPRQSPSQYTPFAETDLLGRREVVASADTPVDDEFTPTSNVDQISFTDPTNGDYSDPLPASVVSAVQAISDASLEIVETGGTVDASGTSAADTAMTPGDGSQQIMDSTSQFLLFAAPDGNLRIASASSAGDGLVFPMSAGAISQDDQGRTLYYYPAQMDAIGVSRIRLGDEDHIPIGSQIISLTSIDTAEGTGAGTFMAFDTRGNHYYLITCTYTDEKSSGKVFLAKDAPKGILTLTDPTMQTTLTGGQINDCALMPFVSPGYSGISE